MLTPSYARRDADKAEALALVQSENVDDIIADMDHKPPSASLQMPPEYGKLEVLKREFGFATF
jgi:hypothetical protein